MKNLVLYFSVYGTAQIVAKEIAKQTGADIAEIEPVVPYDSNRDHYNALAAYAKKEHDEDQRPAMMIPAKHLLRIDCAVVVGNPAKVVKMLEAGRFS